MSFDYNKVKAKSEDPHGNSWTAYSDLFMMLSTVFLLLYVSVSLRSQTNSIEVYQKAKQLAAQNADLEEQIQVYNALRDNHLKKGASGQEQEVYKKLMSKLELLQDEARDEKNELRKKAKENEDKEYALNEYQKLVRNIINTNILSKTQLQRRDQIIGKKESINRDQRRVISTQESEIASLNQTVEENQNKIKQINTDLERKIKALHQQQKSAAITRKQMDQKIAMLRSQSAVTLQKLKAENQKALAELEQSHAQETSQIKQSYAEQTAQMRKEFAANEARLKAELESQLNRERVTGAARLKRMQEFAAQAKARADQLNTQVSELDTKLGAVEAEKGQALAEKSRALAAVEGLSKQNAGLSADLKRAQELANARNELAKRIKGELNKAGLSGSVDGKTGDVTLSFGEEYFDTGSANLKPSMETTLKKFMPGYSKSLFSDPKIAQNIENVEIIGFASSTYNGMYVPPDSLRPQDREAINYNLKLSFNRANAIFKHIFDTNKMSFEHQRDLLPKIKVVGRGYLPDGKQGNDLPAGMTEKVFCQKFNCKQAQKVIIKFKLKD